MSVIDFPYGIELLHDPQFNKGTAFTAEERDKLGLRGLLPPRVSTLQEQVLRVLANFEQKPTDLEKYIYMMALGDRNETLFYRVLIEHLDTMMPIVYTPTVGKACQQYSNIFRRPRGLYISARDRGQIDLRLANWSHDDVRIIVITDGERILGLGDLGANGMGIPVGKLSLYTACAGIDPSQTLPITLDVGTDNEDLLQDPFYLGLSQNRVRGSAYDELVEELVMALTARYPRALIQFEDFATVNAFGLLRRYRERVCTFNDDIQGTAGVTLAALYSALRLTGGQLKGQRLLFLGAGEAGIGIANLVVSALMEEGLTEREARERCWFVDSKGLVVKSRAELATYKLPYAHDHQFLPDFLTAVITLEPTAIIGASGQPNMFTQRILEKMAQLNDRPIVFSLSNPTSRSECTAEEAYRWTDGRAIFASGSPFDPVTVKGKRYVPAQGNNAYVFPGIGLGILVSGARLVTDEMFMAAAKTLAHEVSEADLQKGCILPPLARIREVSTSLATAIAQVAYRRGLATEPEPDDLSTAVGTAMYRPQYRTYS